MQGLRSERGAGTWHGCLAMALLLVCHSAMLGADAATAMRLAVRPSTEEILLGQPLFVTLALRNDGKEPETIQNMKGGRNLGQLDWQIDIAKGDGPWQEIKTRRVSWLVSWGNRPATVLPAGVEQTDHVVVWFSAHGDTPQERSLVFDTEGAYRFRIRMVLFVGPGSERVPLAAEGAVKVAGRPEGLMDTLAVLRGVMEDNAQVSHKNAYKLDKLISDLDASPYALYAKWLRIRCALAAGGDALEGVVGRREAERQVRWCEEVLAAATREEAPLIVRDALTMKGLCRVVQGKHDEAREILKQVESEFTPFPALELLRNWVNSAGRKRK